MEFYDFFDDTTRNRIIELMDSVEKTYNKVNSIKTTVKTLDRRTASIGIAEYAEYDEENNIVNFYDDMGNCIPNIFNI